MVSYTPGEYSMTMFSTLRPPRPPQRPAFVPCIMRVARMMLLGPDRIRPAQHGWQ